MFTTHELLQRDPHFFALKQKDGPFRQTKTNVVKAIQECQTQEDLAVLNTVIVRLMDLTRTTSKHLPEIEEKSSLSIDQKIVTSKLLDVQKDWNPTDQTTAYICSILFSETSETNVTPHIMSQFIIVLGLAMNVVVELGRKLPQQVEAPRKVVSPSIKMHAAAQPAFGD